MLDVIIDADLVTLTFQNVCQYAFTPIALRLVPASNYIGQLSCCDSEAVFLDVSVFVC